MASVNLEKKPATKSGRKASRIVDSQKNIKPYSSSSSAETILKTYRPLFDGNNNIIANAQKGLDITAVYDFSLLSGKSQKEIAELIHTTAKTIQNYTANSKKLPIIQSELLLKLFALFSKGVAVFEGVEGFKNWLRKPAFGLYNDIPETLLTTSTGINEVADELIRIEFGDLA